jgi:hypothetical protein
MSNTEDQILPQQPKSKLLGSHLRARRLLIRILLLIAIFLVIWCYTRPMTKVKVDRILADAGLGKIPVSASEYRTTVAKEQTQDRPPLPPYNVLKGQARRDHAYVYVKFRADTNTISNYIKQSSSLRNESFEVLDSGHHHRHSPPWFPDWFEPADIEEGRWYGFDRKELRVEVFIDSDSGSVYIKIFHSQVPWYQRLWNSIGETTSSSSPPQSSQNSPILQLTDHSPPAQNTYLSEDGMPL